MYYYSLITLKFSIQCLYSKSSSELFLELYEELFKDDELGMSALNNNQLALIRSLIIRDKNTIKDLVGYTYEDWKKFNGIGDQVVVPILEFQQRLIKKYSKYL